MSFLPENYTAPKPNSNYMKFQQGDNRFRVLSEHPIIGYEYWTPDNKPIRSKEMPKEQPENMRIRDPKMHWMTNVKHFWAFVVWDYSDQKLKILQITQASIQNSLTGLFKDKDWGHPSTFDIVITKTGEKMETRYQVTPKPHAPLSPAQEAAKKQKVNLNALYESGDPFAEMTLSEKFLQDEIEKVERIEVSDLPY